MGLVLGNGMGRGRDVDETWVGCGCAVGWPGCGLRVGRWDVDGTLQRGLHGRVWDWDDVDVTCLGVWDVGPGGFEARGWVGGAWIGRWGVGPGLDVARRGWGADDGIELGRIWVGQLGWDVGGTWV